MPSTVRRVVAQRKASIMTIGVDTDLRLQSRRIAVTRGLIAGLDDIRLRLIEMSDVAAADAMAARIDRLQEDLEHQNHIMVAIQARAAIRRCRLTGYRSVGAGPSPLQALPLQNQANGQAQLA